MAELFEEKFVPFWKRDKDKKKKKEQERERQMKEKEKQKAKKEKEKRIVLTEKLPNKKKDAQVESMSMQQKYDYIIREYYDISDTETRKILVSVSEADKNQVLSSITNKLYNNIVEKVDDIDFGTIPNSKGDITKIDNYDKLMECYALLRQIMEQYNQDTKRNLDVIGEAIDNVISRKNLFEKSFQMNLELPMIMYSTIVLSIVSSISFMISSCIEFIKSPTQDTFDIEVDKVALNRTKDNILFDNLKKFNDACRKGQVDTSIEYIIKNNIKNFTGYEIGLVVSGIALIGILLNIIPILRELIFFFYYTRVRVSDYFDVQADLLQMNAYNLETVGKNDAEKKKIAKKQMKIVDLFRKISNTIGIDNKNAEVKATKEIVQKSKEKYKYSDVADSIPDSAGSSIF